MFKQIVVGVDEHEGGRDAVTLAECLLAPAGELTLAYVYAAARHVSRGITPSYEASEEERARELLEKAREDAGVRVQLRWRGSPSVGRGLHELSELIGADVLVVGSSRRALLGRVLIGDDTRAALNGGAMRDRDRTSPLRAAARGVGRVIHGSTSQQLARSTRCPLLVVPRASGAIGASELAEDGRDIAMALTG